MLGEVYKEDDRRLVLFTDATNSMCRAEQFCVAVHGPRKRGMRISIGDLGSMPVILTINQARALADLLMRWTDTGTMDAAE